MNTELNLNRLGYFMKRQLNMNLNSLWIAIAALLGSLLVFSTLFAYFNRAPHELFALRNIYLVIFFICGYLVTSMVFNEMHSPKKSYNFLTLPASKTEKLLATWLVSSPVYVLLFGIVFLLLLVYSTLIANRTDMLSHLIDRNVWLCVKVFLVTQPLFFLGATAFRGNNFLKTLLAVFVFLLIIGIYGGLLFYLLFGNMNTGNYSLSIAPGFKDGAEYIFRTIIPFIFWYLLGPFLLVVSYFKLKERQV